MLMWILLLISITIIIISIIMSPESNSFSGALVGSSDLDLFKVSKERGAKKIIKNIMWWLGIALFVIAIIIRINI